MAVHSSSALAQEPAGHLKRALGVSDLVWLTVAAVANLNIVPVVAAGGPTAMWLWLVAILLFFLPQGIAVIELSKRYPGEGGVYLWAKLIFGDVHGFLCGWCYWTANMFFIPTLLFYLLGLLTYICGPRVAQLAENPVFFGSITICLLWITAFANVRGVGVGKWVNNVGGVGTLIAAVILVILGLAAIGHFGATVSAGAFALRHMDSSTAASFGVICFGLVGLELGCVMGDEIREPARSVPRGVLFAGILCALLYSSTTLALLIAVPQNDLHVLQGLLQGVDLMTARLHCNWILLPLALLVAISIIGATSAWLSGSARILFVSGIDRYLPKVFSKIHPKYATPHVALAGIATLSSILILMSFVGQSSVKEAYITLLDLAVVLQMISYLYVYSSLARVAFGPAFSETGSVRWTVRFAAVCGLAATGLALILAFVPSHQVTSIYTFEIKMVVSLALFLGLAGALFKYYSQRRADESSLGAEA